MAIEETEETTIPHLVIELDGETGVFKAYPQANQFLLARHGDEIFSGGYTGVKAVTVLAVDQALPEERERLNDFLLSHGRNPAYSQALYDALDRCWRGDTNLPFERSPNLSDISSTDETEELSKAG